MFRPPLVKGSWRPATALAMVESAAAVSVPVLSHPTEALLPKSYANVVGNKPTLTKFNVAVDIVDGKAMVDVPEEIFEDSALLWDDFLVGRFPSTAPHEAKIHVIVNKIWNL